MASGGINCPGVSKQYSIFNIRGGIVPYFGVSGCNYAPCVSEGNSVSYK